MYQERSYITFHISPSGERLVNQSGFALSDVHVHLKAHEWKQ